MQYLQGNGLCHVSATSDQHGDHFNDNDNDNDYDNDDANDQAPWRDEVQAERAGRAV